MLKYSAFQLCRNIIIVQCWESIFILMMFSSTKQRSSTNPTILFSTSTSGLSYSRALKTSGWIFMMLRDCQRKSCRRSNWNILKMILKKSMRNFKIWSQVNLNLWRLLIPMIWFLILNRLQVSQSNKRRRVIKTIHALQINMRVIRWVKRFNLVKKLILKTKTMLLWLWLVQLRFQLTRYWRSWYWYRLKTMPMSTSIIHKSMSVSKPLFMIHKEYCNSNRNSTRNQVKLMAV